MLRQRFSQELMVGPTLTNQEGAPASDVPQSSNDVRFLNHVTDCIYVILNSGKPADVHAVADRLNMSYSQFYRKMQAQTGLTPVQYIQRVKIAKAKRTLTAHPEMSLTAVAEQCGFTDYSNFLRAFRNVLGVTPTQHIRTVKTD